MCLGVGLQNDCPQVAISFIESWGCPFVFELSRHTGDGFAQKLGPQRKSVFHVPSILSQLLPLFLSQQGDAAEMTPSHLQIASL